MDASKAGADRARRFPFFEVGRFMRDLQQAAWNVKLIPVRFWLEIRRLRKRLAGGFPVAGWGGGGLAQKGRPAECETPDGRGNQTVKGMGRDSSGNLQQRAAACKGDCPLAAELAAREREVERREREVERWAREVEAQEAALWADAAEVRRARKEIAKLERTRGDAGQGLGACPYCGSVHVDDSAGIVECRECGGRMLKGGRWGWNRRVERKEGRMVDGLAACPHCGRFDFVQPKGAAFVECRCGAKAPSVAVWNRRAGAVGMVRGEVGT